MLQLSPWAYFGIFKSLLTLPAFVAVAFARRRKGDREARNTIITRVVLAYLVVMVVGFAVWVKAYGQQQQTADVRQLSASSAKA